MKDILVEGHRLLTTDEIADAVIAYALALHERGDTDIVEFPIVHDGELSQCALLLGPHAAVVVLQADALLSPALPGADRACAEIERRTLALR